ncbi:helix-turn-helix domain-containing protein [methane-oxidizing endosymbiont of Gigantopelta aegis]|uniref:helix-turn-helix domain-containing protein n=1 Tax=methane-oxidizing endosymbiont of Gigantopelta aegis TaxID=2794938 RepID=UPI001BE4D6E4|nr:helix-turn-helix domain-containing protein [methane-oxidizing endosymbiont of Gigantopelta aegis]
MPIRVTIELSEEELQILETIIKKGSDWRERDRAMTIKLLHEGMSTADIAKQQGHHVESIRRRRRRWLKEGFASLPESPRSGAPQKISLEAQQLLSQWVTEEALTSRYLSLNALNVNQPVAFFAIIYEMNFIKLLDILLC